MLRLYILPYQDLLQISLFKNNDEVCTVILDDHACKMNVSNKDKMPRSQTQNYYSSSETSESDSSATVSPETC